MTDENVPMDVTAFQAEAVVRAAIDWAWDHASDGTYTRAEWMLLVACEGYGDKYKGVRGR